MGWVPERGLVLLLTITCTLHLARSLVDLGYCEETNWAINSTTIPNTPQDIIWNDSGRGSLVRNVIFNTVDGNLLTSNDGGASWQLLDERQLPELWNKTDTLGSNTILYNSPAGVQRLYNQLPYIYAAGVDGRMWVSSNDGTTWKLVYFTHDNMVVHILRVDPHPEVLGRSLVLFETDCCRKECPQCVHGVRHLKSSDDAFDTWIVVETNVAVIWAGFDFVSFEEGHTQWLPKLGDSAMWYLQMLPPKSSDQRLKYKEFLVQTPQYIPSLIGVADFRNTALEPKMFTKANILHVQRDNEIIVALRSTNFEVGETELIASTDDGADWVEPVRLPAPPRFPPDYPINPERFKLLTTKEGHIYIVLRTKADPVIDGEMYATHRDNLKNFSWLAQKVVTSTDVEKYGNVVDFMPVNSGQVEGTFYVNSQERRNSLMNYLTLQTYSNGARFSLINEPTNSFKCPPPVDMEGAWSAKCTLQLAGPSHGSPVLSSRFVPGIILANGVVSNTFVSLDSSRVQSFITTDGGANWAETATSDSELPRARMVHFLASPSGIIGMTPMLLSGKWYYSTDYAASWSMCTFASEQSNFERISFKKEGESKEALVFIRELTKEGTEYQVIRMGVENFITNECDATHDFEAVPIKTADNQDCVMGEILELSRRSSSVVCNPGKSMPGPTRSPCICSKSDIQCADCFYWDREQERCDYGGNCRNREHLTAVPYNCTAPNQFESSDEKTTEPIVGSRCFSLGSTPESAANFTCPPTHTTSLPPEWHRPLSPVGLSPTPQTPSPNFDDKKPPQTFAPEIALVHVDNSHRIVIAASIIIALLAVALIGGVIYMIRKRAMASQGTSQPSLYAGQQGKSDSGPKRKFSMLLEEDAVGNTVGPDNL